VEFQWAKKERKVTLELVLEEREEGYYRMKTQCQQGSEQEEHLMCCTDHALQELPEGQCSLSKPQIERPC
jgi:hypothetical protein